MKLDLLENGIDFIRSGIETFFSTKTAERNPRNHKYAVLHLFSGVLLILKERLSRSHPALIFDRVENYGTASEKTVSFEQLIRRLDTCAGVKLSGDELEILRRAQTLRNALEHYHCNINLYETQKMIAQLIEVAYIFLRRELKIKLEKHLSATTRKRISSLRAIAREIEREELARWNRRADKYRKLPSDQLPAVRFGRGLGMMISAVTCSMCRKVTAVLPERDILICKNVDCRDVRRQLGCVLCNQPAGKEAVCEYCVEDMARQDREREELDSWEDDWWEAHA